MPPGQTVEELAKAEETRAVAHSSCMSTAADHEHAVKAQEDELKVIPEATKVSEKH